MNNIMVSVQRIIRNKNVVTVAGVIIMLVLLYIGYSSQINNAVQPISVPVATETIQPRTEITDAMVEMVDMPNVSVRDNVIRAKAQVVGKYSNINSVIPEGSMFYTNMIISKDELPDSVFVKVKSGEIVYNFPVDMESTYGNSIFPGNKIDIYMKTGDGTDEKVMLGKLVENVEVLAVKDSSGRNVFENTDETRTPAMLLFGVPEQINLLLRKASYMETIGVELFPVPHGGSVDSEDSEGTTEVSTQQLADYIEAHAVNIPIAEKTVTDKLLPTLTVSGNSVKIKYPKGCGYTYTCTYTKDNGSAVTVKAKSKSKTVTKTVTFMASGTISATLNEKDGTAHTAEQAVTIENSTSGTNTNGATDTNGATTNTTGGTTGTVTE